MRILVIDNYDSFVYNLVQYLGQLGVECDVRRNDEVTVAEVGRLDVGGILLSPGPGAPESAGVCLDVLRSCGGDLPIFGVCLGHQAFGAVFGATVTRAPELLHGKTSLVTHLGVGVLAGLPEPFTATRYHSLAVVESTLPAEIEVTGWTVRQSAAAEQERGVVMAMRHRTLPIEGVQFHPESVLTEGGHLMLANWLAACGAPQALDLAPALAAEVDERRLAAFAA
ncbi:MAG: aminodeoxychorismate/anthranilate synthase component II [Hamadaea sp.]|nr:aminodeoxychorismate/anthranilate synthase component II [Hamadaea sp.]